MRLQGLLVQDSLHRGLAGATQTGMARVDRVPPHVSRQRLAGPQLGRVAQFFGLGAGQVHHPGLIGAGDDGLFGTVEQILEPGFHPHFQRLMQTMVNGHPADLEGPLDNGRILARVISQEYPRPFDLAHGRRARPFQSLKTCLLLRGQDQRRKLAFSSHAQL